MLELESIEIRCETDKDPDLSWLGEYSDTPEEHHIDRQKRGDMERNEYRYFNLGCGDPEYIERDYERMEALSRGDWQFIGVRVTAVLVINGTVQNIDSPGLWGIESDSDESYLLEVGKEELGGLCAILAEMGVSQKEINREAGACLEAEICVC